ncbi:MAG TPA: hypothetical protein VKP30_30710, partial [Polyangiaceae bacterium]|nr:hypothetical protein [Polyangiaceae bacterium]
MTNRIAIRDGQPLISMGRNVTLVLLLGVSTNCSSDQVVGRNCSAAGSSVGGSSTGSDSEGPDRQQSSAGGGATSSDGIESSNGHESSG